MSEIEKIKAYEARTNIPRSLSIRYDCHIQELQAVLAENSPIDAMCWAFAYGKAKGYRAGKKAAELEQAHKRTAAARPTVPAVRSCVAQVRA